MSNNITYFYNGKKHRKTDAAFIPSDLKQECEYWLNGIKIQCNNIKEFKEFKEELKKLKISQKTLDF